MKIYLAGPISGLGYLEVVTAYQKKTEKLQAMGYEVLCPMTGKSYLRNELEFKDHGQEAFPVSTNHAIFERDKWLVGNCDIVLADLTQAHERVSIGTVMELAWASLLGKHTLVVLPKTNIHHHAFILEAADIVFETGSEAEQYLEDLIGGV